MFAPRFEESCDGLGTSWLTIKHCWVKNRWLLYHFSKCLFNEKRESTAAPCFFKPNVWTYFSVPRKQWVLNEPFKMERSYFLFIYNPFALQEFNGNFKWKKSNKIEKSSSSFFFSFSALRFLVYLFLVLLCWFCRFFCLFFFFIKLTFLFKTQFVGSLLRNTWAEYNCSVAKSN